MGLLRKTTNAIFGSTPDVTELLRRVFTPCKPGTGSHTVSIKLFDAKHLVGDVAASGDSVRNELQLFFDNLKATPGLPAAVKQQLDTFTFTVEYFTSGPTALERQNFGMMDFPFYLETTDAPQALSVDDAQALLVAHQIPLKTFVKAEIHPHEIQTAPTLSYPQMKEMMEDEDQKEPGIGIPGTYFTREVTQTRCRKIGMIKVNFIKREPVGTIRTKKFIAALKHELGHMFGLGHQAGTLMDEKLSVAIQPGNESYNLVQTQILVEALTILSQA